LLPLPVLLHNAYAASSGAAPGLLLPASVLSLIGIVAVLFNGSILFVTLRSKSSLRGSCIYLLALLSVLEVRYFW
jgi:hypothetical protein